MQKVSFTSNYKKILDSDSDYLVCRVVYDLDYNNEDHISLISEIINYYKEQDKERKAHFIKLTDIDDSFKLCIYHGYMSELECYPNIDCKKFSLVFRTSYKNYTSSKTFEEIYSNSCTIDDWTEIEKEQPASVKFIKIDSL